MAYHFYILFSQTLNNYYMGHSGDDLNLRLRRQNSNHAGITGPVNYWYFVYTEHFESKELALARERQVKKWKSRQLIEKLIASTKNNDSEHPDLASGQVVPPQKTVTQKVAVFVFYRNSFVTTIHQ